MSIAIAGDRQGRGVWPFVCTALVFLFVLAAASRPAFANDYTVTKTADTNDGACNADCSLREAIAAANANPGADHVVLGAGQTYTLSLGPAAALVITDALTIDGNGSTVNGAGLDRVFTIQGVFTVTINNLTITGGVATGDLSLGGGLNVRNATLVLNSCTVAGNSTATESSGRDDGGGIAVVGTYDAPTGTTTLAGLTLNNSTVSGNTGSNGGGIVCVLCALMISHSAISGNAGTGGDGGGIMMVGNSSSLSMTSSNLLNNTISGGLARGGGLSVPFGTNAPALSRDRIVANAGTTGSAIFTNVAAIAAINNWWGCSFGPGAGGGGCAGTPNGVSGAVTTSPYLILKGSVSSASVPPGGSSTMTADLTFNSSTVDTSAGGAVPDGTNVTFSATLGAFATSSSPTTNGKATDVFTAGGTSGAANLSATVDGQTVTAKVIVGNTPPTISGIPDTTTPANTPVVVTFTVGDAETGAASVTVSGTSSNTTLVPNASLAFNGSGVGRALTITPATNQSGTSTITVTTSDGLLTTTSSFVLTVANGLLIAGRLGDFDGDAKADLTVFRPSSGGWHVLHSNTDYSTSSSYSWGLNTDTPVPADYDGDGKIDPAVYRPSTGAWYVLKSSSSYTTSFAVSWGVSTDLPVPGDYDGDGKADPAVYRPSTGGWYILKSSTNYTTSAGVSWGLTTDLPVPGDYDGDGKADPAIYRPSTGLWAVLKSSTNYTTSLTISWGLPTDVAVPGDYDGDGRIDPAVYRPSTGSWYILRSSTSYGSSFGVSWGLGTDIPVPGDFDGDGKTDPAIFRPSTGLWAVLKSGTSYTTSVTASWGVSSDIPILKRP